MSSNSRIPLGRKITSPVLRFLIWLFLRVEVREDNNIPPQGAGIIYYNHIHWLDPVIICGQLKRYAIPLAKIEASRWPVVGQLLKWFNTVFITRGVVDRSALTATWQILRDGDISVISPEGTRSQDGRLQEAKEGLTFVARQAPDAWLIPCAVTGTPAFHWKIPLINRPVAVIRYGRPFRLRWPRDAEGGYSIPDGRAGREMLRQMTEECMIQLAATLPPEMRGAYAEALAREPQWLDFSL